MPDWWGWLGIVLGVIVAVLWGIHRSWSGIKSLREIKEYFANRRNPLPPAVTLTRPHSPSKKMTPIHERTQDGKRTLVSAEVKYSVKVDEPTPIRIEASGARTRDGAVERTLYQGENVFSSGESLNVHGQLDAEILRDAHESDPTGGVLWWVRFARGRERWEVSHDQVDTWTPRGRRTD